MQPKLDSCDLLVYFYRENSISTRYSLNILIFIIFVRYYIRGSTLLKFDTAVSIGSIKKLNQVYIKIDVHKMGLQKL